MDEKYPVHTRIENYYDKTVTLIYIVDGQEVTTVEKIEAEAVTKTGYAMDMETIIRLKESKELPAEEIVKK